MCFSIHTTSWKLCGCHIRKITLPLSPFYFNEYLPATLCPLKWIPLKKRKWWSQKRPPFQYCFINLVQLCVSFWFTQSELKLFLNITPVQTRLICHTRLNPYSVSTLHQYYSTDTAALRMHSRQTLCRSTAVAGRVGWKTIINNNWWEESHNSAK